jgi:hypothetical protein
MNKSRWYVAGLVCLAAVALVGCKSSGQATTAAGQGAGGVYTSKTLTTSYTGALDASSQLMLGMLKLEGTDNAITAEQAQSMLRVMQSLQGQALKADAERNAVWANVENQLTPAQLSAVANMQLTQNDLQTWTQNNQGPGAGPMPDGPAPQGTPGAGPAQGGPAPSGPRPQGTPGAGPGQGGPRPQGTPGATPGQGGSRPQGTPGVPPASGGAAGGVGAGSGQSNVLLNAVIRLLASKLAGVASTPPPGATPMPAPAQP